MTTIDIKYTISEPIPKFTDDAVFRLVWYRALRDQCTSAGVPFLFKQWGNWDANLKYHHDKKALGRVLDGVTHEGFPS